MGKRNQLWLVRQLSSCSKSRIRSYFFMFSGSQKGFGYCGSRSLPEPAFSVPRVVPSLSFSFLPLQDPSHLPGPSFLPKVLQWLCYHGWFFQCWHPFVFSSSHLALIKTHLVSGHSQTDEGQPQMSPGLSPELSRPVFPTTLYAFTLWFHGHCNLSAIKI